MQEVAQEETTTERMVYVIGTKPLLYLDLDSTVTAVALCAPRRLVHLLSLLACAPDQWTEPGTKDGRSDE